MVHSFHDVALSPDGATAAWTETTPSRDGKPRESFVYVKDLRDPGSSPHRIGAAGASDHALAWSRDGRLAFLSSGDSGEQLQVYVVDKPGHGKPRKVTDLKGYISDPHWSPDGRSIAVLWIEGLTRVPGPTEATTVDSGVVSSKVYEQRLAMVDPASGAVHAITPPEMYVYEFDWSPDGKQIAYLASPGAGDDNWYIAELYAIDSSSGAVRHILKPPMQVANVRWSPDGKNLAFIGGLMSDEGSTGGDIFVLPAGGGAPRDLTPNRKSSPNWFRWSPSSNQILMTEDASGEMAISTLDLASGSAEQIWKGAESIVFSGDTTNSVVIRNSWTQPPEVWAGRDGRMAAGHACQRQPCSGVGAGQERGMVERRLPTYRAGCCFRGLMMPPSATPWWSWFTAALRRIRGAPGPGPGCHCNCFRGKGTLCSIPIRAAAMDRAKNSRALMLRISARGICAISWPAWTR